MAEQKTYEFDQKQLTEGVTVTLKAQVGWSQVARHTTPEELARYNNNRTHQVLRPLTYMQLNHVQVLPMTEGQPTLEERFVAERFFTTKNPKPGTPDQGLRYEVRNKSRNLPTLFQITEDNSAKQFEPEGELAPGTNVIVTIRSYRVQGNAGFNLESVIVMDPGPIQYRGVGAIVDNPALTALGISFSGPITPRNSDVITDAPAPGAPDAAGAPTQGYNQPAAGMGGPFGAPAPTQSDNAWAQPQQAPQPAWSEPQQQMPQQTPQMQTQPQVAPQMQMQQQAPAQQAQPQPQAAAPAPVIPASAFAQPAPAAVSPFAQPAAQPEQPVAGISYPTQEAQESY